MVKWGVDSTWSYTLMALWVNPPTVQFSGLDVKVVTTWWFTRPVHWTNSLFLISPATWCVAHSVSSQAKVRLSTLLVLSSSSQVLCWCSGLVFVHMLPVKCCLHRTARLMKSFELKLIWNGRYWSAFFYYAACQLYKPTLSFWLASWGHLSCLRVTPTPTKVSAVMMTGITSFRERFSTSNRWRVSVVTSPRLGREQDSPLSSALASSSGWRLHKTASVKRSLHQLRGFDLSSLRMSQMTSHEGRPTQMPSQIFLDPRTTTES